MRGCEVV